VVERLEYDPNRSANIALVLYKDGERRYILAPKGLKAGDQIQSDKKLHAALLKAAQRGVKAEVLLDGYGSPDLSDAFVGELTSAGV
ncbi:hypothetical protein MJL79_29510, partial [Salmonella enterica subsp. enterica serovar Montevideo]|nr:hypothetical protein [Salmonella enterica subsp. enterica serovar Montevideo]